MCQETQLNNNYTVWNALQWEDQEAGLKTPGASDTMHNLLWAARRLWRIFLDRKFSLLAKPHDSKKCAMQMVPCSPIRLLMHHGDMLWNILHILYPLHIMQCR